MNSPRHITIPDDFRERALSRNVKETMKHYGVGRRTFVRWATEIGIMPTITARARFSPRPRRPMPEGFEARAHLSIRKLHAAYPELSRDRIAQLRKQLGIATADHSDRGLPPPDGFALTVSRMYIAQAARHYAVSEAVIRRWAQITGARFEIWNGWNKGKQALGPQADDSVPGRAADHLRRCGYVPVYKAAVADRKLDGYFVGGRRLATEEMIALAERKGFDPKAWARL